MSKEDGGLKPARLTDSLELAKVAAEGGLAAAVLGYISLRSHFNQLGFSLAAGMGIENYLRETYSFLFDLWTALVEPVVLVLTLWPVLLLAAVAFGGAYLANRKWPAWRVWLLNKRGLLCLAVIAFELMLVQNLVSDAARDGQIGMAVGELRTDAGRWHVGIFFSISAWLCLAAWWLWSKLRPLGEQWRRRRKVLFAATAMLTCFLPVIDGLTKRDADFHLALVMSEGVSEPDCGLVVMSTGSEIMLWKAIAARGIAISIPTGKVKRVVSGPEKNLYQAIQDAARQKQGPYPSCAEIQ